MNPALPADDAPRFSPGSIVRARGREWIVLSGSTPDVLRVRPVTGSDEDATRLHLALEPEPVAPSTFPWPTAEQRASHDGALLLRDALRLSLRRGAGPFRCLGQLAVEPRAYQLVPLLMALKLDPVRLLIADDVGVGKTIEAGLITRELLDRGDVSRFTVLCPPHLVDQWVKELDRHFHLKAVALTASTAARIERDLPVSESPFTAFPYTVVSLDYIKAARRPRQTHLELLRCLLPGWVLATLADRGHPRRHHGTYTGARGACRRRRRGHRVDMVCRVARA